MSTACDSKRCASVEAASPSSVVITLKEPYAPLLSLLAFNNSAAIIISAKKQDEPMKEFIGTGPYMLKERKADQYIQLTRFAGQGNKARLAGEDGFFGADNVDMYGVGHLDSFGTLQKAGANRLADTVKASARPFYAIFLAFSKASSMVPTM